MTPTRTVLLVFPPRARARFLASPSVDSAARIVVCESCSEARRVLESDPSIDLVVTALTFDDGNWYSVLESSVAHGDRAEVIVAAPDAGQRLRDEVRAHGGWDVVEGRVDPAALLAAVKPSTPEAH